MIAKALPFVALGIAIALFFGYVDPTYTGAMKDLQQQITDYNSALKASALYSARETELANEQAAIPADELARLQAFLPNGVDNVQLILDLNGLAARSGVQLSGFNISNGDNSTNQAGNTLQVESANPINHLDLSVSATGTYGAFRTFLAGVESSLRPFDITNLSVKDSATGVYSYTISFRIYWLH